MGNGWRRRVGAVAIAAVLLTLPQGVRGHAGHGDEFSGQPAATGPKPIAVEPEVAARLGIVTEAVVRRSRPQGLVLNGQVEPLPGQEATVTAPVDGRILAILVTPGDRVVQGQPVAVLLSSEVTELQTYAGRGLQGAKSTTSSDHRYKGAIAAPFNLQNPYTERDQRSRRKSVVSAF